MTVSVEDLNLCQECESEPSDSFDTVSIYVADSCGRLFTFTIPRSCHDAGENEVLCFDEDPNDYLQKIWDALANGGNRTIGGIVDNTSALSRLLPSAITVAKCSTSGKNNEV